MRLSRIFSTTNTSLASLPPKTETKSHQHLSTSIPDKTDHKLNEFDSQERQRKAKWRRGDSLSSLSLEDICESRPMCRNFDAEASPGYAGDETSSFEKSGRKELAPQAAPASLERTDELSGRPRRVRDCEQALRRAFNSPLKTNASE